MVNIDMDKLDELTLFNPNEKKEFLRAEYADVGTRNSYGYFFQGCVIKEQLLNKDIAEFDYEEFVDLIKARKVTRKGYDVFISRFFKYVEWYCNKLKIYQKFTKNNVNRQELETFLYKTQVLTREEVYKLAFSLRNKRDAVILILAFEGLNGIEHIEIRNLRPEDIEGNVIRIKTGNVRNIVVLPETIQIINEAVSEEDYDKRENNSRNYGSKNLHYKGYVVKNSSDKNDTISKITVNERLKKILIDYFSDNEIKDAFNIITFSGMIDFASKIEKIRRLDEYDFAKIYHRYGKRSEQSKFLKEEFEKNFFSPKSYKTELEPKYIEAVNSILNYKIDRIQNPKPKIQNTIIEDEADDNKIPDWLEAWRKQCETLGRFGEELAIEWLKSKGLKPKDVSKEYSKGYDIEVEDEGYEVKTSAIDRFYISINEFNTANKMQNKYHIFFVKIDNKQKQIYGYDITNPIEFLELDYDNITGDKGSRLCKVVPSNIEIGFIYDYIKGAETLNHLLPLIPKSQEKEINT